MIYGVYYRYEYASYYTFQSLYDKAVDYPKLCVVTQSLESSYDLLTIKTPPLWIHYRAGKCYPAIFSGLTLLTIKF